MNLTTDWMSVCGNSSLAVWSGTTFGQCFSTLAFSLPSHAVSLIVSSFYLGRYPDRDLANGSFIEFRRLPFPTKVGYTCQSIMALLMFLPLSKLILEIFWMGQLDNIADDVLLALMLSCWILNFAYFRRIQRSRYVLLPGLVYVTFLTAVIFIAQFPVILSFDNDLANSATGSLDFVIFAVYEVLLLFAILALATTTFLVKREVFEVYSFFDEAGQSQQNSTSSSAAPQVKRVNSLLGRLFFWDTFPLLKRGRKYGFESIDSLLTLPRALGADYLLKTFFVSFDRLMRSSGSVIVAADDFSRGSCFHNSEYLDARCSRVSLLKILVKCFGWKFFAIGVLRLLSDSLSFSAPFLLGQLTTFVSDPAQSLSYGGTLAAGLFAASFFAALTNAWFTYLIQCITMQVRSALISATFAKTLITPHAVLNSEFNTGQILTFLSTDTDRIANMLPSFHSLWSLPFQIGIAFYLLYSQLGLYFLAGVVLAVVMIPINFVICRKIMKLTQEMLAAKDERVKVCSEMLQGMKAVKLYAWESIFKSKIAAIRLVEFWRCLRGRKLLDAFCVYFWATTPLLMQLSTFVAFLLLSGQSLTSSRVYTSIALFNMLIAPLNAFPWVVNGMIDGIVSVRRLEKFFRLVQFRDDNAARRRNDAFISRSKYFCSQSHSSEESTAISVSMGASFIYPLKKFENQEQQVVSTIQPFHLQFKSRLIVPSGSLICVIGGLGSGKSAFLLSLAGELLRESGSVYISTAEQHGIGFAPQQPWLIAGSVRRNILFNRPFDAARYEKVINATALNPDLAKMQLGDRTDVGEDGSALSGGQRQRVGLARACYDPAHSVYFLDDPFASVDVKVGRHILKQLVYKLLIEEGKATVVIATTRYDLASRADLVVRLGEGGRVEAIGKPQDALGSKWSPVALAQEDLDVEAESVTESERQPTAASANDDDDVDNNNKEKSQVGSVKMAVWRSYAVAAGWGWVFFALITLLLMQGSRNAADIWLAHWLGGSANATTNGTTANGTDFYLGIYGAIGGANSIFALMRAFSFAYVGLYAAAVFHENLLAAVLNAPLSFFENTPIGRILNRFTGDVWACDDSVPFELNILLAQIAGLLGTLGTIIYAAPLTLAVVAPLGVTYYFLQRFYRYSSRDLKRLQMVVFSPILSHYSNICNGLPVIRSLVQENSVLEANKRLVDANQRVQFNSLLASQWLSTTLQLMGVVAVGACCAVAILEHWRGTADAALVGLSLSYALSLTGFLSGLIGSFTETERQMISVERLKQYIDNLPVEDNVQNTDENSSGARLSNSACSGTDSKRIPAVSFKNVWLRYHESASFALNGISFTVKQGERVAVVGRTGAGKSSLFTALFRLVNIEGGSIEVNGTNTSTFSRQRLRSVLASVPQEPIVFSGTIRFNLDPGNLVSDEILENALNAVQLTGVIRRISNNDNNNCLDCDVGERGARLSLGERQLLCVARALASQSALVLCADEPTASIDSETEARVMKALCQSAHAQGSNGLKRTLLMIAHRLTNVLVDDAFDRVLVVDGGLVVENGPPKELLSSPQSALSRLVNAPSVEPAPPDTPSYSINSDTDNNNSNSNNNGGPVLITIGDHDDDTDDDE